MRTIYPNALEACFDHAGRDTVESWQDENSEHEAERIAREYLLEIQENDVIRAVTFGGMNPNQSDQIIIEE